MANLIINQGTKFYVGDGTDVIGTGNPSGLNGIIKQSNETGFYIQSDVDFTLNFYDGSDWAAHQFIDVSDANYKGGFAFAWGDNTAAFIKTTDSSHVVYVFGRDGDLKVDATPTDSTQAADTIVDGSGSLSITSIDAQNDYTEGLTVANDGTVTFDRTDNNAAYQLKFSGNGITIGSNGDDTITLTGSDEFTSPLTTDGDLFVQAGGSDARLGIGSDGQYLSVSSGAPVWADVTSVSLGTTKQIPFVNSTNDDLDYSSRLTFDSSTNPYLKIIGNGTEQNILRLDDDLNPSTTYMRLSNFGNLTANYIGNSYDILNQANGLFIRTTDTRSMYLRVNSSVDNLGLHSNGNITIGDYSQKTAARLFIKGEGSTSATSAFVVKNSGNANMLTIRDDRAMIWEDGGANYVIFTDGYMNMSNTSTSNVIGPYSNQSMYIGRAITAANASGSINYAMGIGQTLTLGATSNVDTSIIVGKTIQFKGGSRSIIMGNGHTIANAGNSFVGGNGVTVPDTKTLTDSFVFATTGSNINQGGTKLILIGDAPFGFSAGDRNGVFGGSHYSTNSTLHEHYALGTRIRGVENQQVVLGIGTDSGFYLKVESGAAPGVHMGIGSYRPSMGVIKSYATDMTALATDTAGLFYFGTALPADLNVANTGDGVMWIEDVKVAPTASITGAGALYNNSDDLTWTKNMVIGGQINSPYHTLTDGVTITPDFNDSNNMVVTLAGNRAMANPSNLKDGASYTIIVKQDATGGRTLSFGTAFKWAGGTAPTLSTGANAVDILTFVSDGTNLYGSFVGDFQ